MKWLWYVYLKIKIHRLIVDFNGKIPFYFSLQIRNYIPKLLERKIEEEDIGVITPYHAQVISLKKELKAKKRITVGTVEEFQGEEKKVILISAVKTSGKEKALQFIFCPKRLNTAISRAR